MPSFEPDVFEKYLVFLIESLFANRSAIFRDNEAGWQMMPETCCGGTLHQHVYISCSVMHYGAVMQILQRYGQADITNTGEIVEIKFLANG